MTAFCSSGSSSTSSESLDQIEAQFDANEVNVREFPSNDSCPLNNNNGKEECQPSADERTAFVRPLLGGNPHSSYFKDGTTRVDYILVHERCGSISSATPLDTKREGSKRRRRHSTWRQRFLTSLKEFGLLVEEDIERTAQRSICFIKLSAPWSVLENYAENLNMRVPLQVCHTPLLLSWTENLLSKLQLPNVMTQEVPKQPQNYFTCVFKKSKLNRYLGYENKANFFSNIQKSRIVHEILSSAVFGKVKKGEVGINRLIEDEVYAAAFPLHDGPYQVSDSSPNHSNLNSRQILYHYWARYSMWYKYQPLDHIRGYFGERIAIYFAWLGFYTGWLFPAAIVGLLVFLYGLFSIKHNTPAAEICNSVGLYNMCPLCDENLGCRNWDLNEICSYAMMSYLFDHPGTVFYAVFISFWAVSFLEHWKRKSASLAHRWDCMDYTEEEERPRPEFAAKAKDRERNPVTGVLEPSFPLHTRRKRMVAGVGLLFIMISLVVIFIVAVIIYRILVSIPLFQNKKLRSQAHAISSLSGAVVNFIIVMCLGRLYTKLAHKLTGWEMHRTQSEYDDSLTFKVFIFQFVNFYSSIFYIAFVKGRLVGYPGNYMYIMKLTRNEDCSAGGCLIELAQQLAVIMIGKQIVNNIQEVVMPKLKSWWQSKQVKLKESEIQWKADYNNLTEMDGLFEEYLEMVLQFGFLTIFVAAFPLAPLFALLNNWVEIRLDAQKFVCDTRRPVATRAPNIGIWFTILDFLAHFAVISNAFLLAFTSEFLPQMLYKYENDSSLSGYVNFTLATAPAGTVSETCRYRAYRDQNGDHTSFFWRLLAIRLGFIILFEHVVFGVCRLIQLLVPDVPKHLEVRVKRGRYLAKQALLDSNNITQIT